MKFEEFVGHSEPVLAIVSLEPLLKVGAGGGGHPLAHSDAAPVARVRLHEAWASLPNLVPDAVPLACLLQEVIKIPISFFLFSLECGGPVSMAKALVDDMRSFPSEWAKMAVPSLVYTVQMNLQYVAAEHVRAAIGLVTYQK